MPRAGSYPCMFLSFLISFKGPVRLITTCGLEGAHTTHIHIGVLSSHNSHEYKQSHEHASAPGYLGRTQLTYEYINRLMLQIDVLINGVLKHGVDTLNSSASWQRPAARLHSWHLGFFPSSVLGFFYAPCLLLQKSPYIMEKHVLKSVFKRDCFPFRLLSCYCLGVRVRQGMSSGQQTVSSCCCYVPYTKQ